MAKKLNLVDMYGIGLMLEHLVAEGNITCEERDRVILRIARENDIAEYMKLGGGFTFPIQFPLESPMTIFQIYLSQLQNANAGRIDIFGYSGENDQHINRAIAQNPSIREIHYYCAPAKVSDPVEEFEVASRFSIKAPQKLMLESWNTIWNIFEQN